MKDERALSDEEEDERGMKAKDGYEPERNIRLNMLHKLRIEKRESHKFRLVQIHHKQLIRGCQVCLLRSELLVEVTHIFTMLLKHTTNNRRKYFNEINDKHINVLQSLA